MSTTQHTDAIEMAKARRRPLPDTPQVRAYIRLIKEVSQFHDALVQASPSEQQLTEVTETLASVRGVLEDTAVAEREQLYGNGQLGGPNQLLMPPITYDALADDELRAHTVANKYYMGLNDTMHGGVVSVLFDTVMGRMAVGTEGRVCRTAYLTTHYRNITPIGERLDLHVAVEKAEGRKRFITGQLWHGETLCAEAESLFIEVKAGQQ
ncbi:MAG: PaaI family thioesterase [Yaniella sp.]|uniref:PaaI family thioesterase n=2 Tax=Yaniella sp. TaxID=2773929 RepID=UPI0026480C27|nr:PaaI family thioesterase [Yaniella sp.]MDN5704624.1 PaaI family thioesterase [Yaniella sp.]MDN5814594.1 PaaI family thioesterase [Yaniella sp.]MDN5817543.1 PaaI family thioesterase [Yaniella sp.]MDN5839251.1 PaaI family thioesterase [Yaniella sp.]MDN5911593.1 PaaI family thioesterase [Yaniella sp.]